MNESGQRTSNITDGITEKYKRHASHFFGLYMLVYIQNKQCETNLENVLGHELGGLPKHLKKYDKFELRWMVVGDLGSQFHAESAETADFTALGCIVRQEFQNGLCRPTG